ncbi:protein SPMIP1-like [Halichondria panicea]|uniref:protein SPMIP1-like n=1 Tax=Halichondria panicea TaxID=6063 RepID=UPI00312B862A
MGTQVQKCWVESVNKEASLRFAWHLKYSKEFAKGAAKIKRSVPSAKGKSTSVFKSSVSDKMKKIENSPKTKCKTAPCFNSLAKTPDQLSKSDGATARIMRDMRPSSQNTHTLLYNGISAHGEGRFAYLKKRKEKTPEEKYEFPILSSCQYGWKIMKYTSPKPSQYARTCVIKDSFYRNSGIILG